MPKDILEQSSKDHKRGIFKTTFLTFVAFVILTLIGFVFASTYYNSQINKVIKISDKKITINIEKGLGVAEIAELLKQKELLEEPLILKAYLFLNPDKRIEAGYYEFAPNTETNIRKMVDTFMQGSSKRKLTFIEGWRLEEYHAYLSKEINKDFADKFIKSEFTKEGYMFPDTYIVESDFTPENLASWMRNNFNKKFSQELKETAQLNGMAIEDVIVLASLLEREMNIKADRPIIAGILIKRLESDWALQVDASIQYAKGTSKDWWPIVTRDDYKNYESPYNTYINKGLPPSPICNPSESSINAIVNYKQSPNWFYISGRDGKTHYAETLEAHNQNVSRYLK